MTAFRRALFIQLRRIGDVLMCTPAMRAFNRTYPDCQLDFLTELPDVLEGNPHISKLIPVDRSKEYNVAYQFKLIRGIRKRQYDLVVDFFANPRSAYYSYLSRAPIRLSYGFGHRRWAYNLVPAKMAEAAYAASDRLNLLKAVGVNETDPRLDFYYSEDDRGFADQLCRMAGGEKIITISPVSRRQFNRWPLENYARLADLLAREYDAMIFLLAGPGEEMIAERLAEMMQAGSIVPRVTRLGQLGAIFNTAMLHIGNDNGPKHIAVACDTPTFTIFGPHSPVSWTFPDPSRHGFITPAEVCMECSSGKHRNKTNCIELIPIEAVLPKIRILANAVVGAAARS
jgi:ADP-heptose:LPS heptosyltransferase